MHHADLEVEIIKFAFDFDGDRHTEKLGFLGFRRQLDLKFTRLEIDLGLTRSNNYISYTDNVELITITKSLLKLAGAMMAIEDRDTALKVKIILRDIIDPLLDGLSMFDRTATRSYFTEDSVVIDSMTKVEN